MPILATPRSYTCALISNVYVLGILWSASYHVGCLGPRDRELEVGILLPIPEEQRKAREEAVVGVASGSDRARTRVAVQSSFLRLGSADQLLPALEIFGVLELPIVLVLRPRCVHGCANSPLAH